MAPAFIYVLQNLWPFSLFKSDDLKSSNELVRKLSIPDATKRFVFAVRDSESQAVIYILSAQTLSERSALDAECLIRAVQPEAVVAQVGPSALIEMQSGECEAENNVGHQVPTSAFGVLLRSFVDKINREKYENVAGNLVLKEIFGVGFHGNIMAAKRVAKEVDSSFLILETPVLKTFSVEKTSSEIDGSRKFEGLVNSLIPQNMSSVVSSSSRRFCLEDVQLQMVKVVSSLMDASMRTFNSLDSVSAAKAKEILPERDYQVPQFAQSIYPLLIDLHNIFIDLPAIKTALALSQKMLYDVNSGNMVDAQTLSEVYTFRIAVEGLRIALNNAGRLPLQKLVKADKTKVEFLDLTEEDKSHALFAQTLRSQARKFKTIVAIVDASGLAGLRRHWNTSLPAEFRDLVGHLVTSCENDGEVSNHVDKKGLFMNKPILAVGAGATAVLGASSLSKVFPASSFMKVIMFKMPVPFKMMLTQTQKTAAIALGKTFGPSKFVAPGLANSGANATSIMKAAASAEKIRMVAHSVVASVQKTSFSAMRTAFYEIMRKRRVQLQPIGFLPWTTFGFSIAACSGLLVYGDGIECAAESFPAAPSIASLGRGIQSLRQVSQEIGPTVGTKIQKSIESLVHRLSKNSMKTDS